MKASIIIVGEKKEEFLTSSIESCLKQNYKIIEVILVFSHLKNLEFLKKIYNKKIIFKKVSLKMKNPIHDQINKIKEGIKISKGEYIFLLDGDDMFKKNKLNTIMKLNKKKICLDDHIIFRDKKYFYNNYSKIKNNKIYKLFFNEWPDKICTSCISGPKILFDNFFFYNKTINSKYLAIDVLLIIFYLEKLFILKNIFTIKKDDSYSVDKKYSNIFSKVYWERRIEQHKYFNKIYKSKYKFEYFICQCIFYFLKKLENKKII